MPENWYKFALEEIEKSPKKLNDFEKYFMKSIKERLQIGSLTTRQEATLLKIHKKFTEPSIRYMR